MHITANTDVCIGAGICALTAPELFDQDDDGLVKPITTNPPEQLREAAAEAVLLCPSGALDIRQPNTDD